MITMMTANSNSTTSRDETQIHLAEFENEKTRFLNIGRLTLSALYASGKFQETQRICDFVLAVDPDDIETQDYKSDAKYFETHPNEFDPSKVFIHDENNSGSKLKPRRMLRSVSERRPMRRKQLPSPTNINPPPFTNGVHTDHLSRNGSVSDNDVFDGNNNSGTNKEDCDPVPLPRLQRSQSESTKRPTSVLQKIKRFEAQARGDSTTTVSRVPSFRKSLDETEPKTSVSKVQVQRSASASATIVNGGPETNSHAHASSASKIPASTSVLNGSTGNQETKTSVFVKPRIPPVGKIRGTIPETISPERVDPAPQSRIPVTLSNFSHRSSGSVKWNVGTTVEEELRVKLEREFFGSCLLTGAVFTSSDGTILGFSHKGSRATPTEVQSLMERMSKRELITSSKVKLAGTEYSCLSATAHIVRARVGNLGINCSIFKSGVVIALYEHPVFPKPVGKLVQRIGELLTKYEY